MPDTFNKFQPDRTVYLRGFNTFAAAASVHSATPTGFNVSGTFRDPADFAVVVLYDVDDYYEHPSIRYLPDFNLAGLTLSFDLNYGDAVQPIDSPKFPWVDWATLDCIREDGSTAQIPLFQNAMLASPAFPAASVTCNLVTSGLIQPFDRATLWYQNLAFDYIVPAGGTSVEFAFFAAGTGTVHSITVNGTTYSHTESLPAGESSAYVASALASAVNGAQPYVTASASANSVSLNVISSPPAQDGAPFPVSASDGNGPATMRYTSPAFVAAQIASQVNVTNWAAANAPHALMASAGGAAVTLTAARYGTATVNGTSVTIPALSSGVTVFSGITPGSAILIGGVLNTVAGVQSPTQLTLASAAAATGAGVAWVAPRGGHDGNLIQLYSLSKTATLSFDQQQYQLSGGSSNVTWNCAFDFTALGIDSLRQCWLTFAPALGTGAYTASEWVATFSNWQLTGPAATQQLQIAGPGSQRIEQSNSACAYTGTWSEQSGFYSKYYANTTSDPAATLTISYISQFQHDLWIGTSLYNGGPSVSVSVDGDTPTTLATQLTTDSPIVTRRHVRTGIAAGRHAVTIKPASAGTFYFNYLDAVVASGVQAALTPRTTISPSLDFDTNQSFMLPPARIMWMMDQLGYSGPMNEYLGVFWWNERIQTGASYSTAVITFGGAFAGGDSVSITLNGFVLQKSVYPDDTPATIAIHFAAMINSTFTGGWASAAGSAVTITGRSPDSAYTVTLVVSATSAAGTATITQQPQPGQTGNWVIDEAIAPPIHRSTRDWHSDFYAQCASRSLEVVTSCSLELVNPPAGYAALFPNGTPVLTATGFGSLNSTQCAVGAASVLAYQKAVYRCIARLQATAGLTPCVQYGEFLWWYFPLANQMPVGYASETAPISIGTAGPHGLATGNSVVIAGVLGNTAANGKWTITVTDATHFTLNGSSGNGTYTSGGTIAGGGMGYYDAETTAAAQTALSRPLHVFNFPSGDPTVNGSADALFLRNRLRDHVSALVTDIRSAYPNVICELLWPYDVNYPSEVGTPPTGGQLNYYVNLPVEWQSQPTSGLDRVKVEALSFGSSYRNLDLAAQAIALFPGFGWPLNQLRYLVPVFGIACPWVRELGLALAAGIATNNLWAFDHVCLYNLNVPEGSLERRSFGTT